MWRLEFDLHGVDRQASDGPQRRSQLRPDKARGLKSPAHALKVGLAKGSVVLWAAMAATGAYLLQRTSQASVKIIGPSPTAAGLKWEVQGKIPSRRTREITLVVNGVETQVPVTKGRVRQEVDLVPGRNTIQVEGKGFGANEATVVVAADPAQMACDCAHMDGGLAGIIGNLLGSCRETEEKLKAGTAKWCDPGASGPAAWPKQP